MCGQYVTLGQLQWSEFIDLFKLPAYKGPNSDVTIAYPSSTQQVIALMDGEATVTKGRWGWYRDVKAQTGSQYNSRAETLQTYYAKLAKTQRAIVPMSGFIEGAKSKGTQKLFAVAAQSTVAAAAVWKPLSNGSIGFSVLTTHANPTVRAFHHRMPLVFDPSTAQQWLSDSWEDCLPAPAQFDTVSDVPKSLVA